MNKLKNSMALYVGIFVILFYIVPFMSKFIDDKSVPIALLILINPIACIIISVFFGYNNSFNLMYVLIIPLLFLPTIFMFYNSSATYYGVLYFIFTFMGMMSGNFIKRTRDRIIEDKRNI